MPKILYLLIFNCEILADERQDEWLVCVAQVIFVPSHLNLLPSRRCAVVG